MNSGPLAQLARALHLQCRGRRFEPGTVHSLCFVADKFLVVVVRWLVVIVSRTTSHLSTATKWLRKFTIYAERKSVSNEAVHFPSTAYFEAFGNYSFTPQRALVGGYGAKLWAILHLNNLGRKAKILVHSIRNSKFKSQNSKLNFKSKKLRNF